MNTVTVKLEYIIKKERAEHLNPGHSYYEKEQMKIFDDFREWYEAYYGRPLNEALKELAKGCLDSFLTLLVMVVIILATWFFFWAWDIAAK